MTRLKHRAWAGLIPGLLLAFSAAAGDAGPPQELIDNLRASTAGFKNYMLTCGGCHRFDGDGITRNGVPSFRDSVGMFTHLREGREYMIRVPGAAQAHLINAELAEVLNWIVATYSPNELPADFKPFTANEVGAVRRYRYDDVTAARRDIEKALALKGLKPAPYFYGKN